MLKGFLWCPHCSRPHALSDAFCVETGRALGATHHVRTPAAVHAPWLGLELDQKYRLLKRIGTGGMGTVFEAQDLALRRRVAVKIATQEDARLVREAEFLASLQDPNVCRVLDIGRTPWGSPYIVLERLVGQTLRQRLDNGVLTTETAAAVLDQLLSGLHAAHTAYIAHRDVKPENIFLVERDHAEPLVKILDFGFALDLSGARADTKLTRCGTTCGTVRYMAPEQIMGAPVDHRTDIFAAGIVLFEMLTGRPPFPGETKMDVQRNVLHGTRPRLSLLRTDLPPAIDDVLDRALERDPNRRFSSAIAFQYALLDALDSVASTSVARRTDEHWSALTVATLPNLDTSSDLTGVT